MRNSTFALAAALAIAAGLPAVPAMAEPTPCAGWYSLEEPLDVGGGVAPFRLLVVTPSDDGVPAVSLGDTTVLPSTTVCPATQVTRAPRTDAFAVRAKFEGCGERPRFRLRLRFDAACETVVVGRMRAAGRVLASFTAGRVRRGDFRPIAPDDPVVADPGSGVPSAPDAPAPGAPEPEAPVVPVGTTPTISTLAPPVAQPGETISVFGANLDRDANGDVWVDTTAEAPYVVTFLGVDPAFGRLRAVPTFVSPERIDVRVPTTAVSGTLVLAVRRTVGAGRRLSETTERLIVVREDAPPADVPQAGTPPVTANAGTLALQETALSLFDAGTFPVSGPFQIGAFLDTNDDRVVNLFPSGRDDVPYLAFPVRSSEFDFAIERGRGYFLGANAILWVFFEGGDPAVLDANDRFFVVHLRVDLATRTAQPIAMLAGVAGDPGIVMMADQFATETSITVAQPGGGVGAIAGRIAAVPLFLENVFLPSQPGVCGDPSGFCPDLGPSVEQRLWANGVVIDFDVPLFADN